MSSYHIEFLDDEVLDFITERVEYNNEIASFFWKEEWWDGKTLSIHLSNLAYFRSFKQPSNDVYVEDLIIHFKNWKVSWMQKWEIYTSWPYLVVDTEYDATFIPMKNVKYYEKY